MATRQPSFTSPTRCSSGNVDVGEEHLVEARRAVDLSQRPYLDAGRLHVDDEARDALVLRRVGIGARDDEPPLGVLGSRRPHLLAVEDPVSGRRVALGARLEGCDVGPCVGLRPQLTPDLRALDHLGEETLLLFLGAVRHDRRPDHPEADRVHAGRDVEARHLLSEDEGLHRRRVAAPVRLRPRDRGVAGFVQRALPVLRLLDELVGILGLLTEQVGDRLFALGTKLGVCFEPRADLVAPSRVFGGVLEVHSVFSFEGFRQDTRSASDNAFEKTASSIGSVSLPVNVFCWLG